MKRTLPLLTALTSLLLAGCGRHTVTKDTAPAAFAPPPKPAPAPPNPPDLLVAVDAGQAPGVASPVAEVSEFAGHTVELRLVNARVGQPMVITFEAHNERGTVLHSSKIETVPTAPQWTCFDNVQGSTNAALAGRWYWTARIADGPTYTTSISVLPPSASEMARLARFEKARENVLRAFSYFWLAHGEHLFTKILLPDVPGADGITYLQLREWSPNMSWANVSEVDRLNGITFRGGASFSFKYFRTYRVPDGGWSEWSEDHARLERIVANAQPVDKLPVNSILKLSYRFLEKDGNWFVEAAGDGQIVNGMREANRELYTVQPPPAEIQALLEFGHVPVREADKALGDLAIKQLPAPTRAVIDTMTLLRGATLR